MADPVVTTAPATPVTTATTAPAPAPVAAVPAETPAAAPASDAAPTTAAPAAADAPSAPSPAAEQPTSTAAEPTPAAEAKAPESEPASVLGEAPKLPAPAAETAAPATTEAPPAEPAPAPPPSYEFKWPEGVTAPPADDLKPFTGTLAEAKIAPEVGQKLLDLHFAEVTRQAERLEKQARETWDTARREWVNQMKSDPELGGNRFPTVVALAKEVLTRFGGNETQLAELRDVLNLTGAGDHPAAVRLLYNIGKALSEGQPVVAARPVAAPTTRAQRRYAGSIPNPNGAA